MASGRSFDMPDGRHEHVWDNKWTPINLPFDQTPATSPSPSFFELSDCEDEVEVKPPQEEPSPFASHLRANILEAAQRMKWTGKGRKRTAMDPISPEAPAKKRARTTSDEKSPKPKRVTSRKPSLRLRETRKPTIAQTARGDTIFVASKRGHSDALSSGNEDLLSPTPLTPSNTQARPGPKSMSITEKLRARIKDPDEKDHSEEKTRDGSEQDDLFGDDDSGILALLEAEKAMDVQKQTRKPKAFKYPTSGDTSSVVPTQSILQAGKKSQSPTPPMAPFMRDFNPLPSPPRSPISPVAGLSVYNRVPTCFRIAEAIRHLSSFSTAKGPEIGREINNSIGPKSQVMEIFAIVRGGEPDGPNAHLQLADIFFPNKPPYLTGSLVGATEWYSAGAPTPFSEGDMIHAIVEAKGNPSSQTAGATETPGRPLANKHTLQILMIGATDWTTINRVKSRLDEALEGRATVAAAGGKGEEKVTGQRN